jgi:hypothetical protein
MRDYVFKLPDSGLQTADRTIIKKAVASVFGDRHDGTDPRYLFSPEPRHDLGPWLRVRVCVDGLEVNPGIARQIAVPVPGRGALVQGFAWVALKQKFPISDRERALAKLADMRGLFEEALDITVFEVGEELGLANMERGRSRFQRAFGRVRLEGSVKDQDALTGLMRTGVGAAKAYGFGLVDIKQKAEQDE